MRDRSDDFLAGGAAVVLASIFISMLMAVGDRNCSVLTWWDIIKAIFIIALIMLATVEVYKYFKGIK